MKTGTAGFTPSPVHDSIHKDIGDILQNYIIHLDGCAVQNSKDEANKHEDLVNTISKSELQTRHNTKDDELHRKRT